MPTLHMVQSGLCDSIIKFTGETLFQNCICKATGVVNLRVVVYRWVRKSSWVSSSFACDTLGVLVFLAQVETSGTKADSDLELVATVIMDASAVKWLWCGNTVLIKICLSTMRPW